MMRASSVCRGSKTERKRLDSFLLHLSVTGLQMRAQSMSMDAHSTSPTGFKQAIKSLLQLTDGRPGRRGRRKEAGGRRKEAGGRRN